MLRYSSASAITVERSTTATHSDASWQHCSPTTGACLATMAPSLPGGHRRTASSAAVRRLWQQRCPHRTAAHPLALPSRQRCVHCCATRSVAAALALHQGSARASGASGQRQRPRGAAKGHTRSKIERESGHKRRGDAGARRRPTLAAKRASTTPRISRGGSASVGLLCSALVPALRRWKRSRASRRRCEPSSSASRPRVSAWAGS